MTPQFTSGAGEVSNAVGAGVWTGVPRVENKVGAGVVAPHAAVAGWETVVGAAVGIVWNVAECLDPSGVFGSGRNLAY